MFGVLVVKDSLGNLGWLAAYSGKLSEEPQGYFVPPVADIHAAQSFYKKGEAELNDMSAAIAALEEDLKRTARKKSNSRSPRRNQRALKRKGRAALKEAKKARQKYREAVRPTVSAEDFEGICERLASESIQGQLAFKHSSKEWLAEQEALVEKLDQFDTDIKDLKEERRLKSNALQREIFDHYTLPQCPWRITGT
jgi:tRNA pseudouridine32 synthase/23S rRNA pseudouridine746 synthase